MTQIFEFAQENQTMVVILIIALIAFMTYKKGYDTTIMSFFIVSGLLWVYFHSYKEYGLQEIIVNDPANIVSIFLLAVPLLLALFALNRAKAIKTRGSSHDQTI